jgi:putative transposase
MTRQYRLTALRSVSHQRSCGDCYDNAIAESFFATRECELLIRSSFPTYADARAAPFDFIEIFYNRQRRQSALGYLSPEGFARSLQETPVVA